ncbi:hypothetical protein [Nitratiruptor tergarcus]|nr:hypothetical protein [Nitratiruptor tergarcus]
MIANATKRIIDRADYIKSIIDILIPQQRVRLKKILQKRALRQRKNLRY